MVSEEKPEKFGYNEFCIAVTGCNVGGIVRAYEHELRPHIENHITSFGRDMPRTEEDRYLETSSTFMRTRLDSFPLLDIPIDKMYEAYSKFKKDEEYVHPPKQFPAYARYWKLTFEKIEDAHQRKDEQTFKEEISELIHKILSNCLNNPILRELEKSSITDHLN